MAEWKAIASYHPMQLPLWPQLPTEVHEWYNYVVATNRDRIQRAVMTVAMETRPHANLVEQSIDVFINYKGREDLILP